MKPAILLIRAGFDRGQGRNYRPWVLMEPLGLAILAALTPPAFRVQVADDRCERVPLDAAVDLVAISCCTFSVLRAYALAAAFRARGIPVVLGGFHPTLAPEEAARHADVVATGDAEATWPLILEDFLRGTLKPRYGVPGAPPCLGVRPDRSVLGGRRYLPIQLVQFGRGCRNRCEFCAIGAFHGGAYVSRPVPEVLAEIRESGRRRVFFVDDNLMTSRPACVALLEALVPLNIRWSSQIDIACADDPGLLALMRRSGCQSLTIGIESLDPGNLQAMHKPLNRPERYAGQLERLRRAGIMIYGSFLFGYAGDGPGSFAATARFAGREGLFLANFIPLMPLPGTPLYQRLHGEGRLIRPEWWLEPGFNWMQPLLEPAGMSSAELAQGCLAARRRFNGLGSLLRRLVKAPAHHRRLDNLVAFLAGNLLNRLDLAAKYRANT